ncbi:hypothetical protein [Serratia marcescens]|uniref:hypothetical protein n=1 Tax=Serratia marcescens TaxID=615 RepID=UPI0020786618|nr:hypothetical protein [Serratia marcescens]
MRHKQPLHLFADLDLRPLRQRQPQQARRQAFARVGFQIARQTIQRGARPIARRRD